jgi:phage-related protein
MSSLKNGSNGSGVSPAEAKKAWELSGGGDAGNQVYAASDKGLLDMVKALGDDNAAFWIGRASHAINYRNSKLPEQAKASFANATNKAQNFMSDDE